MRQFLLARIAEDISRDCGGSGEYRECAEMVDAFEAHAEARRVIVLEHAEEDGRCRKCVAFHADMDCENEPWPCLTLRALALPYAEHPDFREEWRA